MGPAAAAEPTSIPARAVCLFVAFTAAPGLCMYAKLRDRIQLLYSAGNPSVQEYEAAESAARNLKDPSGPVNVTTPAMDLASQVRSWSCNIHRATGILQIPCS